MILGKIKNNGFQAAEHARLPVSFFFANHGQGMTTVNEDKVRKSINPGIVSLFTPSTCARPFSLA